MYDAIVVGARCAGSPTAMLLAQKGYRVLVVDRSAFPSDIMSTHALRAPGVGKLRDWGLLSPVAASNCPPIRQATFDIGQFHMTVPMPPWEDIDAVYCPRRTVLDTILVEAAVAAGAELRQSFTVDGLTFDGDRVTGIRGHARHGAEVTEDARIVIGADGLHSVVARAVKAPVVREVPAGTCAYYNYYSGLPVEGYEFYFRERRNILVFPTNDDLVCVAVQWPKDEFRTVRAAIEANFTTALALAPPFAERMAGARAEERFVGSGDLPNMFRRPFGPGWALVGDASYHKDPILGSGITDAFHEATLLADAIDAAFAGREDIAATLARYEQQRDEYAKEIFEPTARLVQFPAPQEALAIWAGSAPA